MSEGAEDAVYQMLWDCKYCGQKKLLGLTHRFCANCGGPQDPGARYFPSDEEKIAVHDHPYVGADVTCPACRQPMSRAAKCCTNCGSPIDKGSAVALRSDVVVPAPGGLPGSNPAIPTGHVAPGFTAGPPGGAAAGAPEPAKSRGGLVFGIVAAIVAGLVGLLLVAIFWKREATLDVTAHTWERTVEVERFDVARRSAWCDELPFGAREVARHREKRSTKQVKDGETCQTRKKDRGDGTYKEVRECTPRYRDEPVMGDRCEYEITEWHPVRTLAERGSSLKDTPRWPVASLRSGTCLGCEREGARKETYTLRFVDRRSGEEATCNLAQNRWAATPDGARFKAKVRVMTGGVDCDALERP